MRTRWYRAALVGSATFVGALGGQAAVDAQSRPFKSGIELVQLAVTVTDRAGRHVPDLTAADFAVFEEGRPQVVSQFAAGRASIDVGLLLDTSSSMQDALPLAQKAACGLVGRLRAGDRAAVIGIGSSVVSLQSLTPELAQVTAALHSTRASGNTALYDAVYIALRQYERERSSTSELRRRVIVVLSDGIDTSSHVTFDGLLDAVRRIDATIYIVSLGSQPMLVSPLVDRAASESAHALSALVHESGGRLFTPRTARELPAIYDAIGEELIDQYVLGYVPAAPAADGTFRRISIGVTGPRAAIARTRAGYYAGGARGE
jgi:Ca-activated chloride channel homolog